MSEVSYKSLGNALNRLGEAMSRFEHHRDDDFRDAMRDSVLMSFQFTYELCRPMLVRFLVEDGENPQLVNESSLAGLIRTANERGVLRADWATWSGFRDARNRMAHTYSEAVSLELVAKVPAFYEEARYLYEQLEARSRAR